MARTRSSSGALRYLNPAYYLKRPKRLAFLFIMFVFVSFVVWDRQTLVREHEVEISELVAKINRLQDQLEDLTGAKGARDEKNDLPRKNELPGKDDLSGKNDVPVDPVDMQRREKVKEAMLHAWNSYDKYAWGQDELQPQSKSGVNSFGGLGATLIDSLDTLYIMGLDEQFQKAREWVANSLDFNKDYDASVFETTIRLR